MRGRECAELKKELESDDWPSDSPTAAWWKIQCTRFLDASMRFSLTALAAWDMDLADEEAVERLEIGATPQVATSIHA